MTRQPGRHKLRTRWAALRRRPYRGGGSVVLLVVAVIPAALLMLGLIVDGVGKVRAISRADNIAEEAARAGTTGLSLNSVGSSGGVVLDSAVARSAAQAYLARVAAQGTVTVTGNRLTVTVTLTAGTAFLGAIGIDHWTVTGHGTAELVRT